MPAVARVPLQPLRPPHEPYQARMAWPSGIAADYYRYLRGVVRATHALILAEVEPMLPALLASAGVRLDAPDGEDPSKARVRADAQGNVRNVDRVAARMAKRVNAHNRAQLRQQSFDQLGVDVFQNDPDLSRQVRAFVRENVRLITGLVDDQVDRAFALIFEGARTGLRVEALAQQLRDELGISYRRAKLIAVDQIGSINATINQVRQEGVGVTDYTWDSSDDERVRPLHRALDNTKHKWSKPPISGTRGERQHPGHPIRCRCNAIPDMESALDALLGDRPPAPSRSVAKIPVTLDARKLSDRARERLAAITRYRNTRDLATDLRQALRSNDEAAMRLSIRRAVKTKFPSLLSRDVAHERANADSMQFVNLGRGIWGDHHPYSGQVRIGRSHRAGLEAGLGRVEAGEAVGAMTDTQQFTLHAMIHEEIHGTSPTRHEIYQRSGATIEELTTELLARQVSRAFGITTRMVDDPRPDGDDGAYGRQIHRTLSLVENLTGWQRAESTQRAIKAAAKMRGRRRTSPISDPQTYVVEFGRALGLSETQANALYAAMETDERSRVRRDGGFGADVAFDECKPGDTEAALAVLRLIIAESRIVPPQVIHHLAQMNPQRDMYAELDRLYRDAGVTPLDDDPDLDPSKIAL